MASLYPGFYKTYFKVGIFSIAILLLFILSYAWLTNRLGGGSMMELSILFDDVSGLEIGDKVVFRGMEAGRIRDVSITDEGILVKAGIKREIKLLSGTSYHVGDSSLMGGKQLVIEQGSGKEALDVSQIQAGLSKPGLMAVITQGAELITELKSLVEQIRSPEGIIPKTENLLQDAGEGINKLQTQSTELVSDLRSTLTKLDTTISKVNSSIEENQADITRSISQTPMLLQNAAATMDSLQAISANLNRTLNRINSADGSANRLINDSDLYEKLLDSIENLDKLIADIKANPKKYINIRVF